MTSSGISTAEQKAQSIGRAALGRPNAWQRFLRWLRSQTVTLLTFIAVLVVTGGIEFWMGRSPLGPDGRFGLWEGSIWSNECSQRLADPYSFSHLTHGILFCGFLWLVARKLPLRHRYFAAL